MDKVSINKYIVADPQICHGKPVFKGTRIMVWQVPELLAQGETTASIRKGFPSLKIEHVGAALDY